MSANMTRALPIASAMSGRKPFPIMQAALAAAKSAAERQQLAGEDADISYQLSDGRWQTEHVGGGDRPATEVVDDPGASTP